MAITGRRGTGICTTIWRLWLVVGVMLIAMLIYVLSDNERFRFGGSAGQTSPPVPAMGP